MIYIEARRRVGDSPCLVGLSFAAVNRHEASERQGVELANNNNNTSQSLKVKKEGTEVSTTPFNAQPSQRIRPVVAQSRVCFAGATAVLSALPGLGAIRLIWPITDDLCHIQGSSGNAFDMLEKLVRDFHRSTSFFLILPILRHAQASAMGPGLYTAPPSVFLTSLCLVHATDGVTTATTARNFRMTKNTNPGTRKPDRTFQPPRPPLNLRLPPSNAMPNIDGVKISA